MKNNIGFKKSIKRSNASEIEGGIDFNYEIDHNSGKSNYKPAKPVMKDNRREFNRDHKRFSSYDE